MFICAYNNLMIIRLRIFLKKYLPNLYNSTQPIRKRIYNIFYTRSNYINILSDFAEFAPNVSGEIEKKIKDTKFNITNYSSKILEISNKSFNIGEFIDLKNSEDRVLGDLFTKFGSDKKTHQYDYLYEHIFKDLNQIEVLIEIGIGTNNKNYLSNMSHLGKPGASLRAFSEYIPNAKIIGLEYDKGVLFNEGNIKTSYFDQLDNNEIDKIINTFSNKVDVLIDDGLHSVIANINSIKIASKILKKGGYLIIEDISIDGLNLLKIAFNLIDNIFNVDIYTNQSCYAAALKRI